MNTPSPLPRYAAEELVTLSPAGLISLMIADEDRVPRNVIDECAGRADAMIEHLTAVVEDKTGGPQDPLPGRWWLRLHAAMILGLIPSDAAGLLLVKLMRRMSQDNDHTLQDWLAGDWPALFRNKPESVLPALRALAEDSNSDWYIRANAMEACVAAHHVRGKDALAQALDWLAAIAGTEQEDLEVRLSAGNTLLDFPRPQYRPLLEDLAARQRGWGTHFDRADIKYDYAKGIDAPGWARFEDPWRFYKQGEIIARQRRWAEEDARRETEESKDEYEDDDVDLFIDEPHVRATPKVGRNDPCP
jgi:HEAT repeat protein